MVQQLYNTYVPTTLTRTCINGQMLQMTVRTKEDHQNYHLSVHMHATPWTIRIRSLLILVQRQGIHLLSQNCPMRSGCCYYPLPLAEMNLTIKMLLRKMYAAAAVFMFPWVGQCSSFHLHSYSIEPPFVTRPICTPCNPLLIHL